MAGRTKLRDCPDLSHLALPGAEIAVRVTPRASRHSVTLEGTIVAIRVTAVPEDGKANTAVRALLAQALGVPQTRLRLVRGATSRDKAFRIDP